MLFRGSKFFALAACTVGMLGMGALELFAQAKTLTRQYDPIAFDAHLSSSTLFDLPIAELTAYRYEAAGDRFVRIPFQVDEVDTNGGYFTETDGFIDFNDEIAFMPGDAGDRAGTDKWLNDAGAIANPRYELEVTDPINTAQKAWVYLFRNVSNLPAAPAPYVSYVPDPNGAGADTIKAKSYVSANNQKHGLPNYGAVIQSNGSRSADLIDQLKLRINGIALGFVAYKASEEVNLDSARTRASGGPVRIIREATVNLSFPQLGIGKLTEFAIPIVYYPYSNLVSFKNARIDSASADLYGANMLRQSLDFSANVLGTGMKFYNARNQGGVNIDGVRETPHPDTTVEVSKINWVVSTGSVASFITLVSVPAIGTRQSLYFFDSSTGGTRDGTTDTGDLKSYGDIGIRVDGQKIQGQFSFDFSLYYLNALPASDPVAVGEQFKALQENPVTVLATQQSNTSAVASPAVDLNSFALYDAYPNPFAPAKEKIRIAFNTGAAKAQADLRIYNLVGQEVARFSSRDAVRTNGRQELSWNGVDRLGHALPAGVYFYKLQVGHQVAVKKLVLMR